MKKVILTIACLMFLTQPALASKGKVRMAYVEWDCATASTMVAKAALEEMGFEVETLPVAAAAMWQALGTGDVDAMVTAWLPVTHADYYDKVKDKVEKVSVVSGGAKLGGAVPKYVTINSIEKMNANADKFGGKVIGIDPGAGLMKLSEQAMADYKLDKLELMEGSGATMTAPWPTPSRTRSGSWSRPGPRTGCSASGNSNTWKTPRGCLAARKKSRPLCARVWTRTYPRCTPSSRTSSGIPRPSCRWLWPGIRKAEALKKMPCVF